MPLNTNRKSHEYPLIAINPHFCSENQRPPHVFLAPKTAWQTMAAHFGRRTWHCQRRTEYSDFDFQGIKGYGALTWFNHEKLKV
jgi:hypothetical protein